MKKLIAFFLLVLSLSTFAQDIDWNTFNKSLSEDARYENTPYSFFASLERFEETPEANWANYFSGIGGFNGEGKFISSRYEIISEKWTNVEGAWHTDQWLFALNRNHQIIFKLHRKLIRTVDSMAVQVVDIPEETEAYEAKLNQLLLEWMGHLSN